MKSVINKKVGLFLLLALVFLSCPGFSMAKGAKDKGPDGTDLFTAQVLANGTVVLYKNNEHLGSILAQVFGKGSTMWDLFRFQAWAKDPRFNAMAFLPNQAKVGLSYSVTFTANAVHVLYRMTALQDVQVINVRAALFTPYAPWISAPFIWGGGSGTVPSIHETNFTLGSKALELNTVGPALKDGFTLQWSGVGLHGTLQDNRTWSPDLVFTWDHDEPVDRTWLWKAGEEKVFDFTLGLNRDLVFPTEAGEKTANGFEGNWSGYVEVPDHKMNYRVSLLVEKMPQGKWNIHSSEVDGGQWNIKKDGKVTVKGRTLRIDAKNGNVLEVKLDPSGQNLDGINKDATTTYQAHFHRGLEYVLPRVDGEGKAVTEYSYQQPQSLSDGWESGDLSRSPLDPKMVKRGLDQILNQGFPHCESLVLVQGGKLLVDEYFYGTKAGDEHQLQSVTKTVLSILFGIAQDQGLVNTHDKLYDYFPEFRKEKNWEEVKNKITLDHMLTMTSGLPCDDWVGAENSCGQGMWGNPDWLNYVLSMPLNHKPGEFYAYCTSCMEPLGEIIARKSGMAIPDFAQKYLYDPLGIQAHSWWTGPNKVTETGGSHRLRPRDMAKLGYLFLKKEKWKGQQVVSEKWVEESTKFHVNPLHQVTWTYSYLWWQGKGPFQDREIPYFFAGGKFGQFIFVVPELDLVCVMTGADDDLVMAGQDFFKAYILGAFK